MNLSQMKKALSATENPEVHHVKQLTPKRWKQFMLQVLQKMTASPKFSQNKNLITDLITIVSKISQSNFIQSALQIRPFKPEFVQQNVLEVYVTQSTVTSTITKVAKFKGENLKNKQIQLKKSKVTQKNLSFQFKKSYHPYHYIFKNFSYLLQLKYKKLIDVKKLKVSEVKTQLKQDMDIFYQFIKQSSSPYKKLFKIQVAEEEQKSYNKMTKFIQNFIFQNQKINSTIHKIIQYAVKAQYSQHLCQKIKDFVQPSDFDIPLLFRIDGSYLKSMSSLLQFSQMTDHQQLMKKMVEFRNNILRDIDYFYKDKQGQCKDLQLNAQAQIQIIRYIVAKLKSFAVQIYSQLKYLELIYGDEQIAYKYEQVSFMYTQLMLTFEILQLE